jgi:hypothetical protein
MGAQQIDNIGLHHGGVSFLVGVEKAHVLILKPEDLAQRNAIIDALLNLSTLRNQYQLVYLAAPRLLGASMDASIFRARGIGLLFFDERRIDEAVAPEPIQPGPATVASSQTNNALVTELATLKSMYREMERTLNQLRDDLTSLSRVPTVQQELPRLSEPAQTVAAQSIFPHNGTEGGRLPSYFANNPWLEVLSKRGNGEHEAIAG